MPPFVQLGIMGGTGGIHETSPHRHESFMDIAVPLAGMVVSNTYMGKWSILTNIFQVGWNHQPEMFLLFRNHGIFKFKSRRVVILYVPCKS